MAMPLLLYSMFLPNQITFPCHIGSSLEQLSLQAVSQSHGIMAWWMVTFQQITVHDIEILVQDTEVLNLIV